MHCIVGLGNPESRYENTRHNIGFRVADACAGRMGISYSSGKGEYVCAAGRFGGAPVLLMKPVTYMNRSGFAVSHAAAYYGINYSDILVVCDELDLPFCTLRFRRKGSDGGNKGLRSIIEQSGTDEFPRLRVGIRNRDTIANPSSYVLSPFTRRESAVIPDLLETAADAAGSWITGGIQAAMNAYNRRFDFGDA